MTAALILTSASHTIACASCSAPWPREAAQCPGCGRIAVASITAQVAAPSPDDLRAQLAAVTAERDALHAAVRTLADAQLACDAADDATGSARDAARLRHDHASIALYALVPAAPAHNPGARVVATGGGR
jgi:hypothetical protein